MLSGDEKFTIVLPAAVSEMLACPMRISIPELVPDETEACTKTIRLCWLKIPVPLLPVYVVEPIFNVTLVILNCVTPSFWFDIFADTDTPACALCEDAGEATVATAGNTRFAGT